MALKGVCTSPNGVAGCKSPTCPGSSFNGNLESFRFYMNDLYETKKYGSRDEWDSLEINMTIAIDSMIEDYLILDPKSREEIRNTFTDEEKEIISEYSEEFNPDEIFKATTNFSPDELSGIEDAYLEAAFWTEGDSLDGLGMKDLDDHSHLSATKDIMHFLAENEDVVKEALKHITPKQIGHDLWLTRNGHGTGYWDRRELKEAGVSDKLTEAAKNLKEKSLISSDGSVYFE
jgi:hypothetical protein